MKQIFYRYPNLSHRKKQSLCSFPKHSKVQPNSLPENIKPTKSLYKFTDFRKSDQGLHVNAIYVVDPF